MEPVNTVKKELKSIKRLFNQRWVRWASLALIVILLGALFFYHEEVPPVLAQAAVSSLHDMAPAASQGQKVLVFSPHPDDETIAVGGYMYESHKNGADIRIVLVTNGNFHHNEKTRYSEFQKATAILGIPENDLIYLNFPDSLLRRQNPQILSNAFKQQIDSFDPDIIIYPNPVDYNADHATIGKIMNELLKSYPQKTAYEFLVHYEVLYPRPREFNPELYILPPDKLLTTDYWLSFPLSQNTENIKENAVFVYRSQLNDPWLKGLLLSYVRKNELFSLPKN